MTCDPSCSRVYSSAQKLLLLIRTSPTGLLTKEIILNQTIHTSTPNRSEGKKAKGKARKKRGKKAKQLSTSRDERDGEEVSGPSEDEIETEQTPIYEADASPHSSEDKLILNVLDPLSAIVEEVAWSTGFTRDAVTAMVNVMFDRGLAYDNTEAVIKELNKLVTAT